MSYQVPPPRHPWLAAWRIYLQPASLRMFTLGFSAGLPLLLVLGTLSFWLRRAGIDRTTIGYLSWVGLAYGFKWMWAPLVDRMPIPLLTRRLGRRRSWLLLSQLMIMAGLVGMAFNDPQQMLQPVVWCALAVAFGSATQDIALDAFRIESADASQQAALAAVYQTGYRLAMIWAGAGALWLVSYATPVQQADAAPIYLHGAWQTAYLVMAASMLLGVVTVLLSCEPAMQARKTDSQQIVQTRNLYATTGVPLYGVVLFLTLIFMGALLALPTSLSLPSMTWAALGSLLLAAAVYTFLIILIFRRGLRIRIPARLVPATAWFTHAFYLPFADFVQRYGAKALLILALIATYRISDIVMGIMANPFYVDMGFTEAEVATVSKVYGVIMTLAGAFLGGALTMRLGVMRVLMLGAVLSASSNLLFAWLASYGHSMPGLIFAVSADNLAGGIASAAFIAYLSSLTNISYSATQYALFSSIMLLLPKGLAGFSGRYVDAFGYVPFFITTALLGVPVLFLVWLATRLPDRPQPPPPQTSGD